MGEIRRGASCFEEFKWAQENGSRGTVHKVWCKRSWLLYRTIKKCRWGTNCVLWVSKVQLYLVRQQLNQDQLAWCWCWCYVYYTTTRKNWGAIWGVALIDTSQSTKLRDRKNNTHTQIAECIKYPTLILDGGTYKSARSLIHMLLLHHTVACMWIVSLSVCEIMCPEQCNINSLWICNSFKTKNFDFIHTYSVVL